MMPGSHVFMIIIVIAMTQSTVRCLAKKHISPFNGIVNENVVNLAVNNVKQFHTSISLVEIMLDS